MDTVHGLYERWVDFVGKNARFAGIAILVLMLVVVGAVLIWGGILPGSGHTIWRQKFSIGSESVDTLIGELHSAQNLS